jgi:DNA-binding MarR family transcriptional regulator
MSSCNLQNEWVNPKTGEVGSGFISVKGKRYPRGIEFATVFQEGLLRLTRLDLTPTSLRVLFFVMSRMDYQNYVRVTQRTIADELNISPPAVSVAFKDLIRQQVLVYSAEPADPQRRVMRVSATVAWRGNASDYLADQTKPLMAPERGTELPSATESECAPGAGFSST